MYQNWTQKHFGSEQKDNFWSKAITTLWGSHWKRVTLQWRTEVNYILYCGCSSRYLTFEWQLWFEHIVECRRCWQHNHNHDSHQILPQIILWIQSNKHCLHLSGWGGVFLGCHLLCKNICTVSTGKAFQAAGFSSWVVALVAVVFPLSIKQIFCILGGCPAHNEEEIPRWTATGAEPLYPQGDPP